MQRIKATSKWHLHYKNALPESNRICFELKNIYFYNFLDLVLFGRTFFSFFLTSVGVLCVTVFGFSSTAACFSTTILFVEEEEEEEEEEELLVFPLVRFGRAFRVRLDLPLFF